MSFKRVGPDSAFRRFVSLGALSLLALVCTFVTAHGFDRTAQVDSTKHERAIDFNIPRQSLGAALAAFGAITGLEVIADARLSRGRESSLVMGIMPPQQALAGMLEGTGLAFYIDDHGYVRISERPRVSELQFSPVRSLFAPYFAAVQRAVLAAACGQQLSEPGKYRVALSIWLNSVGTVERVKLLDTTGNVPRDEALALALGGINVGMSLPAGFVQPVTLVISPSSSHENPCVGEVRRAAN